MNLEEKQLREKERNKFLARVYKDVVSNPEAIKCFNEAIIYATEKIPGFKREILLCSYNSFSLGTFINEGIETRINVHFHQLPILPWQEVDDNTPYRATVITMGGSCCYMYIPTIPQDVRQHHGYCFDTEPKNYNKLEKLAKEIYAFFHELVLSAECFD
jgi:hypothetical protein